MPDYISDPETLLAAQKGDERAMEQVVSSNLGLVKSIALRFTGRGVETEDLIQIGSIGMLKAIRSFDTERGTAFSTYAVPLIIGEIRRFLRDDGLIKIGRRQKKLGASLLNAREKYMAEHGSEPQLHELAAEFGVTDADAALALDAISPVHSMSQSMGDGDNEFSLEDLLQAEDEIERRTDQMALRQVLDGLPELWRKIIFYRYFRDYSQQNTADMLGLTQVKISREEKKIFAYLREESLR